MPALKDLNDQIVVCERCPLSQSRTRAVPGEGNEGARILFVGEGPGWHEDQQGRPFVGPAGQFLNQLLASVSLRREDVYITNIVKCRPPDNRDPRPEEIEACSVYLKEQIARIKPALIVCLGRHSLGTFFPGESISRVHGTARVKDGTTVFAMYHPAAALHQQSLRRTIEEDMKKIPGILAEAEKRVAGAAEADVQPQQLNLF